MPVPATSPVFATDATYGTDGDAWDGDANKVDPGAPIRAEGLEPGTVPAEWLNFLFNLWGAWLLWIVERLGGLTGTGEWSYETAKVRETWIDAREIVSGRNKLDAGVYGAISMDDGWRPYELTTAGPPDTVSATGWVSTSSPGLYGHVPLHLPSGSTLSAVSFYFEKGTSQAVAADQIQVAVVRRAISVASLALDPPAAETVVASNSAGSGTGQAGVTLSSIGEVIDRSLYTYALRVRSSQGADTTADKISGFHVQWSDPGPRSSF